MVLEQMDLPRLDAMNEYHKYNPPLHMMIGTYLKMRKQRVKAKREADDSTVIEIAKVAQGTTPANRLAIYKGGNIPKIGDPLWPTTAST